MAAGVHWSAALLFLFLFLRLELLDPQLNLLQFDLARVRHGRIVKRIGKAKI